MPRYFFNRTDGTRDLDEEGLDLPSVDHARYEALIFAADTLKEDAFAVWDGEDLRIEVVDSRNVQIFSVLISVTDHTSSLLVVS